MLSPAQEGPVPSPPLSEPQGQERVDAIVADARGRPRDEPGEPASVPTSLLDPTTDSIEIGLAEEIEHARRLLEAMGDQLAADPAILQRHVRAMQGFDLVGQILGHVAKVIRTGDKKAAIDGIGMRDLQSRLKRQVF